MDEREQIMAILYHELEMEMKCYDRALKIWRNTSNPLKKLRRKQAVNMFGAHVAELKVVINRIEREVD